MIYDFVRVEWDVAVAVADVKIIRGIDGDRVFPFQRQIWKRTAVDVTRYQTEKTPVEVLSRTNPSDIDNCSVHAIRVKGRDVAGLCRGASC